MKFESDNGKYVCVYCGQVDRYDTVNEFVDFYDDRHRIIRKSLCRRKYHIQNTLFDKYKRYNIQLSTNDKYRILESFEKIESVLPQINVNQKRMININFILKQISERLNCKSIPIYKSKRTLAILEWDSNTNWGWYQNNYSEINFCEYSLSHLSTKGHISMTISSGTHSWILIAV